MVHVAGVEAIEVVEAESVGPVVERPGGAGLPCRSVVVLADPRGHVAVLPQHFADGAAASRQNARVTVVAGRDLGDAGECGGVMIAAGDECGPRRAAEGGGVEAVVAKAFGGEAVHSRRRDAAAEGAELAEAAVVDQDEKDVWRAFGRLHRLWELGGVGVEIGPADLAGKMEIGPGQHIWCSAFVVRVCHGALLCLFIAVPLVGSARARECRVHRVERRTDFTLGPEGPYWGAFSG